MAQRGSKATDADRVVAAAEAEVQEVTVVSPDGEHEETVADPSYLNSLIYGRGYRVKDDKMSTTEALATVTDPVAATGETSQ